MKKYIFKFLISSTKYFDGCLSPIEIKTFVLNKYSNLNLKESETNLSSNVLERIKDNLITLGWVVEIKGIQNTNKSKNNNTLLVAVDWINQLKNGKVINQGTIAKDTGIYLDMLDESGGDLQDFTAKSLESLLKYVEIKRKKTLSSFSQNITKENKTLEGMGISILFSRFAKRHSDLRFLNAAFKMNDWFFPKLRTAVGGKPLVYYLLSLTEQEITVAELLK